MTPEEKSLLERTYKIVEENNIILRAMRRANRFGIFMKILYWLVIIGISVGVLYSLQPYLQKVTNAFGEAQNALSGINTSIDQAQNVLNSVKVPAN